MARSTAALAWANSFDALAMRLFNIGRETTDAYVQAEMDNIDTMVRVDTALSTGAVQTAIQTLLTRTAAIKAKTDNLP